MERNHSSENLERFDDLLRSGSYEQLSSEDRQWVDEIVGKQAFQELGLLLTGIREEQFQKVSSATKSMLMARFKTRNQSIWARVWNYQVSVALPLLITLLAIVAFLLLPTKERIVTNTVEIPATPVIDTVFVKSEPDTVFIEKLTEVPVYITKYVEQPQEEGTQTPATVVQNKSLADQEELRELLKQVGVD